MPPASLPLPVRSPSLFFPHLTPFWPSHLSSSVFFGPSDRHPQGGMLCATPNRTQNTADHLPVSPTWLRLPVGKG